MRYAVMYRLGLTPRERYGAAAAGTVKVLLDREEAERTRPLGRALDVGVEEAFAGWEMVSVQAAETTGLRPPHLPPNAPLVGRDPGLGQPTVRSAILIPRGARRSPSSHLRLRCS